MVLVQAGPQSPPPHRSGRVEVAPDPAWRRRGVGRAGPHAPSPLRGPRPTPW